MSTSEKHRFIDFLRGSAVFLMLWGHCIQYCCLGQFDFFENNVFKFIYSFHMPLFMLLSGYLFFYSCEKRELNELLIHKTNAIFPPIIMCSIFNYLITTGLVELIRGRYSSVLNGNWLNDIKSLWFLWSVLACSYVMGFAVKTKKKLLCFLLLLFGFVVMAVFPNSTYNIYMYPYFIFGYCFSKWESKLARIEKPLKLTSLVIFFVMIAFYEKKHYIYTTGIMGHDYSVITYLSIDVFRWIIGLVGSISAITLLEAIFLLMNKKNCRISGSIETLGKYSLAIYALQTSLLSFYLPHIAKTIFGSILKIEWQNLMVLYNLIITPIIAVVYSFVLLSIIRFLYKKGIGKILFGR